MIPMARILGTMVHYKARDLSEGIFIKSGNTSKELAPQESLLLYKRVGVYQASASSDYNDLHLRMNIITYSRTSSPIRQSKRYRQKWSHWNFTRFGKKLKRKAESI